MRSFLALMTPSDGGVHPIASMQREFVKHYLRAVDQTMHVSFVIRIVPLTVAGSTGKLKPSFYEKKALVIQPTSSKETYGSRRAKEKLMKPSRAELLFATSPITWGL